MMDYTSKSLSMTDYTFGSLHGGSCFCPPQWNCRQSESSLPFPHALSSSHPDKCAATGMDSDAASDVLKDINEAFNCLKPLVENGEKIHPTKSKVPEQPCVEATYSSAVEEMESASTAEEFDALKDLFQSFAGYRDSASRAHQCAYKARVMRDGVKEETKTAPYGPEAQNAEEQSRDGGASPHDDSNGKVGGGGANLVRVLVGIACLVAVLVAAVIALNQFGSQSEHSDS